MAKRASLTKYIKRAFVISMLFFLAGCGSDENYFQGYIEGNYSYIASAVSGNLTKNLVDKGDQVKANQPLFVLDPQPETDKLAQAGSQLARANQQLLDLQKGARPTVVEGLKAQIKQARASLVFARQTYKRYQTLYRSRTVDKATFDKATSDYKQNIEEVKTLEAQLADSLLGARENQIFAQKAVVDAAEATVKQAQWALLQKSVRATLDAQVYDTVYEVGEFVAAGQPAVVLLPPIDIKIIFFIPEKSLSQIAIGDEAIIDCDSCKNSHKAKVTFIASNAEFTPPVIFSKDSREKLVYRVEAKMPVWAAKKFHPGQPVDVIIEKDKGVKT